MHIRTKIEVDTFLEIKQGLKNHDQHFERYKAVLGAREDGSYNAERCEAVFPTRKLQVLITRASEAGLPELRTYLDAHELDIAIDLEVYWEIYTAFSLFSSAIFSLQRYHKNEIHFVSR